MKSILFKEMDKRYVKPGTPGAKRGKRGGWYVEEPKLPTKKNIPKEGYIKYELMNLKIKIMFIKEKINMDNLYLDQQEIVKQMNLI